VIGWWWRGGGHAGDEESYRKRKKMGNLISLAIYQIDLQIIRKFGISPHSFRFSILSVYYCHFNSTSGPEQSENGLSPELVLCVTHMSQKK
jgi:hypothetical protein